MNKPTLANLYRQATRDDSTLPDADMLVVLAQGERPADAERIITEIAQSALQSDLLHFARALEPESSALNAELQAAFGEDRARHTHTPTHVAPVRTAAGRWRNLRRAAVGIAAALIVAVAMWTQHAPSVVPAPVAKAAPDRIFAAFDDRNIAQNQSDEIFNGSFKSDVIFRTN